jgi:isoamylase
MREDRDMARRVWPGRPFPLGATVENGGVNFALFSANAERVDVCLFSKDGKRELERVRMVEYTDQIWHCHLPGITAGQLYGYRVYGAYAPERGHRFNHHKLLIDPYARKLAGPLHWDHACFGYRIGDDRRDLSFDHRDSARFMPKCEVVDEASAPPAPPRTRVGWPESTIYELHVRGFTMRHPEVPEDLRGTFAGLGTPAVMSYLKTLGVTTLELLPAQSFVDDHHLQQLGLRNYWGYSTLNFFAPEPRYLRSGQSDEVRAFTRAAHEAGLEVLLDVVYNHTAEGNELGPTLSYRGIDNATYYRLRSDDQRYYADCTGTGNTLALHEPAVLRLTTDSLRYWVEHMHVDGFRFDLAPALARNASGEFDPHSAFFQALGQDPVLKHTKLIAEPWDLGEGGYRLGGFPPGWAEWNDRYRDTVRRFWRGDSGVVSELATRLTGSSDLYDRQGRRPWSSVNLITTHDGFTLLDLVSFNGKHNEQNPHDNQDGGDHNNSWNCGAEGATDDPAVLALRAKLQRNLIATLLLSQGTPLLLAGDELGRTQRGNNNAYCQDNELSWLDWSEAQSPAAQSLLAFTRTLLELRRDHIVFRRQHFLTGHIIPGTDVMDVVWFNGDGTPRMVSDWASSDDSFLGCVLHGEAGDYHWTAAGERAQDVSALVALNAGREPIELWVPSCGLDAQWQVMIDTDTDRARGDDGRPLLSPGEMYALGPRSLVLMLGRGK